MNEEFPFKPKSTKNIEQGQYWAVPLESGGFGCGVVLAKISQHGKTDTRLFLAGLLNWFGDSQPTLSNIQGSPIIETGFAHVKSITEMGGEILGAGFQVSGTPKEVEITDSISTWGYTFMSKLASKHATNS